MIITPENPHVTDANDGLLIDKQEAYTHILNKDPKGS